MPTLTENDTAKLCRALHVNPDKANADEMIAAARTLTETNASLERQVATLDARLRGDPAQLSATGTAGKNPTPGYVPTGVTMTLPGRRGAAPSVLEPENMNPGFEAEVDAMLAREAREGRTLSRNEARSRVHRALLEHAR